MLHIIKDIFTRPQVRPLGAALLLATALTACEDQLPTADTSAGNGPTLTLCIDNEEEDPATRTSLDNADPTHHVQAVKILIFKGMGDDATYLDQETLTWPAGEDGNRVDRKEYTLQHLFTEEGDYTLLGVGMDAATDDAFNYDFKDASDPDTPTELTAGTTTLANAYACLKDGKSPADCEFFTGTVSFTYRKNHNIEVDDLLMRRRVAGVMLYVTDIPQSINKMRTTKITLELCEKEKSSVRLQRAFDYLNWTESGQSATNNKVLATIDLLEQDADGNYKYAYTQGQDCYQTDGKNMTAYAGRYMLPLNAPAEGTATLQVKIHGKTISSTDTGDGTKLEGEESELKAFKVQNRSEASDNGQPIINFAIRSNYIYCIGKKGEGIDEPMSLGNDAILLEVLHWQRLDPTVDFDPARIQAIFDPGFDEDKYIFNCINNTFTVKVLPSLFKDGWKIEIPTETQAYNGSFEETMYSTADADKNNPNYMTPWLYILKSDDTVTQTYECTAEEAEKGAEITFVMLDYAVYRPWGWSEDHQWTNDATAIDQINNDIRQIVVTLTTTPQKSEGGGDANPRKDVLTIKQYNTITVDFKSNQDNDGDEVAICGFSRVDWGDRFVKFPTESTSVENDPDIPDMVIEGFTDNPGCYKSSGWGWYNVTAYSLTGGEYNDHTYGSKSDGAHNVERIGMETILIDNDIWDKFWNTSASYKCERPFLSAKEDATTNYAKPSGEAKTTDKCWYLPAQYEMEGLYRASAESDDHESSKLNINSTLSTGTMEGVGWWTSTLYQVAGSGATMQAVGIGPITYNEYTFSLGPFPRTAGNSDVEGTEYPGSGQWMYMRQARKFTKYYIDKNESEWVTYPNGEAEQTNP